MLVVEDLHFATATTRETVRRIARSSTHAPILMLITTRDTAPDVDDELGCYRRPRPYAGGRLHRPRRFASRRGRRPPRPVGSTADSTAVTNETGGNPLLVVEVARSRRDNAKPLHAMLARRYALPTEADLRAVDVASVVGTEFDLDVVARTVGCDVEAALASLERISAAGLVHSVPGRPRAFAFTHRCSGEPATTASSRRHA